MLIATTCCSLLLIMIGVGGWLVTSQTSWTALIPAAIGLMLGLSALIAQRMPGARKHAMHGAAGLALLGIAGSALGVVRLIAWLGGTEPARPAAAVSQSLTALVLLVFLFLAVRRFIAARRARQVG